MDKHMSTLGHDMSSLHDKHRIAAEKNRYVETGADVIMNASSEFSAATESGNGGKLRQSDRLLDGVADGSQRSKTDRMGKLQRRDRNRHARKGEADRHTTVSLPKHLFSGKRGNGKTDFR